MSNDTDVVKELDSKVKRPIFLRVVFSLVWSLITVFIIQTLLGMVVMGRAGNGVGSGNWSGTAAQMEYIIFWNEYGTYISIGLIFTCILLSLFGLFPGTSKHKK